MGKYVGMTLDNLCMGEVELMSKYFGMTVEKLCKDKHMSRVLALSQQWF